MDDYKDWVGRQKTVADVAAPDRVAGLMALLDDHAPLPDVLPPLAHWLLAQPMVRQSDIGDDGHPKRAGDTLLPPIALSRRMWAASEVDFLTPIPLCAPVERRTTVSAITPKQGRSGAMVFVTLDHEIRHGGTAAIRERQHIVYREMPGATIAPASTAFTAAIPSTTRAFIVDPVMLFRYSALTFNGHRIHYDRKYAALEGYPDLVVHGPLAATLLLSHGCAQRPGQTIGRFAFRAVSPLFANTSFTLAIADNDLWITDADGVVAMTAEILWA